MKRAVAAAFFTAIFFCGAAMAAGKAVAVMPFAGPDTTAQTRARGERIAERLSSFIAQSGLVTVVERIQIEKVYNEIIRGQSGAITENTAAEAGKMIGAAHMIVGSWSYAGKNISVQARIVNSETGVVTAAVIKDGLKEAQVTDEVAIKLLDYFDVSTTFNQSYRIKRTLAWVAVAGAVGCGGAAFWSHDQYGIADKNYRTAMTGLAEDFTSLADKAQLFSNLRAGLACGGAALLGTGIVLFAINKSEWKFERRKKVQGAILPVLTPRSIGLCYSVSVGGF